MALNTPLDTQYMPHHPAAQTAATRGILGRNKFHKPEGCFVFGRAPMDYMVAVDLDLQELKGEDGVVREHVVGVNLLCPRCTGSLYVHGKQHPAGREIIVHWDRMIMNEQDGFVRPPITIVGAIACDYTDGEMNGIVGPRQVSKCGWRGVIEEGKCHEAARGPGTNGGLIVSSGG